jgi:hypothetical protein
MILRRYVNADGSTRFLLALHPLRKPYPIQAYSVPRHGEYDIELFNTETATRVGVDHARTADAGVNRARIALLNSASYDKIDLTEGWDEVEVPK